MTIQIEILFFQIADPKYHLHGVPRSHPMFLAEAFIAEPHALSKFRWNYTIEGIAKLLMYRSFLKVRVETGQNTTEDLLIDELDKYPYTKKKTCKVANSSL